MMSNSENWGAGEGVTEARHSTFKPGPGVGVIGLQHLAVVDAPRNSEIVESICYMIEHSYDFDSIISTLIDLGLRNLPDLALVQVEGESVRSIVRGGVLLKLTLNSGEDVVIDASSVHTWVEHAQADVESLTISLGEPSTGEESGVNDDFNVLLGVVPVSVLTAPVDRGLSIGVQSAADVTTGSPDLQPDTSADEDFGSDEADFSEVEDGLSDVDDDVELMDELPIEPEVAGPDEPEGQVDNSDQLLEDDLHLEGDQPLEDVESDLDPTDPDAPDVAELSDVAEEPVSEEQDSGPGDSSRPETESESDGDPESDRDPNLDSQTDEIPSVDHTVVFADESKTWMPGNDSDVLWAAAAIAVDSLAGDSGEGSAGQIEEEVGVAPGPADRLDEYDHLFGATQYRPVSDAGVDSEDAPDPGSESQSHAGAPGLAGDLIAGVPGSTPPIAASTDDFGDHDGMTISLAQLRAAASAQGVAAPSATSSGHTSGPTGVPMVHAVFCPAGHQNSPASASCRTCGVEIPDQPHLSVPRPVLGTLRFSNGEERILDGDMLLGRSPKVQGRVEGTLPRLVALESVNKELSGTHLEVRIEGWQVTVIDRHSTNGTTVCLPSREPQRLHPGEPMPIVPGTVVNMADEVSFTYEVRP